MDLTEHWRQRLLELKVDLGLTQAALGAKLELSPDYVSRLLYAPGKKGRKNLGLQTLRNATKAYGLQPDWFDLPLGAAMPSAQGEADGHTSKVAPPSPISRAMAWPFVRVTPHQYNQLSADQRDHIERTILLLIPPDAESARQKRVSR